jgi:hypothetical protein
MFAKEEYTMITVTALIQFIVLLAVLAGAYALWRKRKISNFTACTICLILLALMTLMTQLASFDRVYRRPVPEKMLKIEIPTTERIYLLWGIREDILAQSSLFGLHQLTIDIKEARAEAGLRDTYKKVSPFWKHQHTVELIDHLKRWEKTGPLHTPFPILSGMRKGHAPGLRDENWPIARSIIEMHVASREYKMLGLLLDEYVEQMRQLHRTALRKDQVEKQFTTDIKTIDEALAGVDRDSDKWREVLTFDRSLDTTNGRPEQTAQTADNTTKEADVLREDSALAEAIHFVFFIAAKIIPPGQTTFQISSPGGDRASFTKIKSGVWRPSFVAHDLSPEWSVEGSILHQARLGGRSETDMTQVFPDANTLDWETVTELKHKDTLIVTLFRRDEDVIVTFGTPPDQIKLVIEW